MKKITSRKKLLLYGCAGLGINLLNMIVGSYLTSAIVASGFESNVEFWSFANKDLVAASIWGIIIVVAKIVDGIIDIPMSSLTDNLKTRFGRRRPAIFIGMLLTIASYLLFLLPFDKEPWLNILFYGGILILFYTVYTLTMLTYYATFAEIVDNEKDRVFLSNTKSICDVIYFSLSFALVPIFVNGGMNIRLVALLFLPLSLTMLIPLFLIKEDRTDGEYSKNEKVKPVSLVESFTMSFKNSKFIYWMCVSCVMTVGLQLFLSGINEFFSVIPDVPGYYMTVVMASSFAPVPFTILLYNKIVKNKGFGFGYRYALLMFSIGMSLFYFCSEYTTDISVLLVMGVVSAIFVSFGIGTFFSAGYTVPSYLAQVENERTGKCNSSMYFAVEGLFEGIASGIASGIILMNLKENYQCEYIPMLSAMGCMAAFVMSFFLSDGISKLGMSDLLTTDSINNVEIIDEDSLEENNEEVEEKNTLENKTE